jgi:NAD(P)H-dependent FMN reductase
MKIGIISSSHRKNSRSMQTARWVSEVLVQKNFECELFDLAEMEFPFWNEEFWKADSDETADWIPISERLSSCVGFVLISPEWAGMMPPKLTNFLLLCSRQELSYKPTLLVSVSAGPSGTYPIAQLRMSGSKNNQMVFLPDHLIIRNVSTFFDELNEQHPIFKRLEFNLEVMGSLVPAFQQLRKTIEVNRYPYGL